jgi:TRAP-type C4-dicarboxylate transport system substrate-binding protein
MLRTDQARDIDRFLQEADPQHRNRRATRNLVICLQQSDARAPCAYAYILTYTAAPSGIAPREGGGIPIANPDNLKGLKIAPTSKLIAHELQLLGADPVSLTYQETPSALQRGMIDGITFPMAGIYSQKFGDLLPVHMNVSLGGGIAMIFMMKKKFDALSPQAQKILLDTSGEAMSRKDGALYDRLTNEAVTTYKADPNQSFVELSPAMHAKWAQDTASIETDWVKQGVGRDKVLAKFKELLAQLQTGK